MLVSNPRTAAEILVSGEEPVIFDDLSCLRDFIAATPLTAGARVFVADHRTTEWVPAHIAVVAKPLPRNPAGKVLKRDLRDRFEA